MSDNFDIWIVISYSWTEIGLEEQDFAKYAEKIIANHQTWEDVNAVIRTVASKYPNVVVLDWGTAAAQPGLMNRDNVHPNDTGRQVLVGSIATALGNAPMGTGSCLPSKYTDDSLVTGDNTMPSSSSAGQSTVPGAGTSLIRTRRMIPN